MKESACMHTQLHNLQPQLQLELVTSNNPRNSCTASRYTAGAGTSLCRACQRVLACVHRTSAAHQLPITHVTYTHVTDTHITCTCLTLDLVPAVVPTA
mmetsp:Transcript_97/g.172  ORF Transcript_97/g.172 Transcript_97/m.172 type:complete len:98 (+) Transcript_97:426-719(+)